VTSRWSKRGVVVPTPLPLEWSVSHAALPVVHEARDGSLRLLCSSRDDQGRSQIAGGWLDLERGCATFDEGILVPVGTLGTFDDHGVTSSCVVAHDERLFLYYTGWNLGQTVPFYLEIGCAVSEDDGGTFQKVSAGPVLGRNTVDPILTASPFVLVERGRWRMWYVSGTGWRIDDDRPRHRYHIRYAESDDGISWHPSGHVCIDYRDERETAISRPCVVRDGSDYRMWFSARGTTYRIGYAESTDGLAWRRVGEDPVIEPSADGWDSEMQAYPFVFAHADEWHMLYNGNGFGATGIGHAMLE
jgi:hypothetical protein